MDNILKVIEEKEKDESKDSHTITSSVHSATNEKAAKAKQSDSSPSIPMTKVKVLK